MRLRMHMVLCVNVGYTPFALANVSSHQLFVSDITSPSVIVVEEDDQAPDPLDIIPLNQVGL